jgi:ABC-type polysaccharide transport system permease subunit
MVATNVCGKAITSIKFSIYCSKLLHKEMQQLILTSSHMPHHLLKKFAMMGRIFYCKNYIPVCKEFCQVLMFLELQKIPFGFKTLKFLLILCQVFRNSGHQSNSYCVKIIIFKGMFSESPNTISIVLDSFFSAIFYAYLKHSCRNI